MIMQLLDLEAKVRFIFKRKKLSEPCLEGIILPFLKFIKESAAGMIIATNRFFIFHKIILDFWKMCITTLI
jgi:hypothetical protein